MTKFKDILQRYVDLDYDELLFIGKKALVNLMPACVKSDPRNRGELMIMSIILAAVGADGKLSPKERRFVCDLLEIDTDTFNKYSDAFSRKMKNITDLFADSLSPAVKGDTITLIVCVVACDERISREETEFIKRIME